MYAVSLTQFIQLKNIAANSRGYFAASLLTVSPVSLSALLHKQMILWRVLRESNEQI